MPRGIFKGQEMSIDISSFRGGSTGEGAEGAAEFRGTVGTMKGVRRTQRDQESELKTKLKNKYTK